MDFFTVILDFDRPPAHTSPSLQHLQLDAQTVPFGYFEAFVHAMANHPGDLAPNLEDRNPTSKASRDLPVDKEVFEFFRAVKTKRLEAVP